MLWAVLTASGALYTFGECDSGKLGLTTEQLPRHRVPQPVRRLPRPVEHFKKGRVRQVVCAENHSAVITGKRYRHRLDLSPA